MFNVIYFITMGVALIINVGMLGAALANYANGVDVPIGAMLFFCANLFALLVSLYRFDWK